MYNKLFQKILDSSIWLEDAHVRLVWITFLAAMDKDGVVALSAPGNVAARARVSQEQAENALEVLEAPDQRSPGQEHEGRRIERIQGVGWLVFNARKYRDIQRAEDSREQVRRRVAKHRAINVTPRNACNENVTPRNACNENVTPRNACNENVTTSSVSADACTPVLPDVPVQLPSHVDAQAAPAREKVGKTRKPKDASFQAEFDAFWVAYPRRLDIGRAREKYSARRREGVTPADLQAAAGHYADECRREAREPKFILHAATFLGPSGRWQEFVTVPEPEEAQRQAPELEPGEWIPGYRTPEPERVLTPEDILAREEVGARMREKSRAILAGRLA